MIVLEWLRYAFAHWVAYALVCRFGWGCKRNFTSTYGCVHCWRTGYETYKGRRYYGAQHCRDVVDAMRRHRGEDVLTKLPRARVVQ